MLQGILQVRANMDGNVKSRSKFQTRSVTYKSDFNILVIHDDTLLNHQN